jgi:hypothetical protein
MKRKDYDDLMKIRESGLANMCFIPEVEKVAYDMKFYDLVRWIELHKKEYLTMILEGRVDYDEEGDRD